MYEWLRDLPTAASSSAHSIPDKPAAFNWKCAAPKSSAVMHDVHCTFMKSLAVVIMRYCDWHSSFRAMRPVMWQAESLFINHHTLLSILNFTQLFCTLHSWHEPKQQVRLEMPTRSVPKTQDSVLRICILSLYLKYQGRCCWRCCLVYLVLYWGLLSKSKVWCHNILPVQICL